MTPILLAIINSGRVGKGIVKAIRTHKLHQFYSPRITCCELSKLSDCIEFFDQEKAAALETAADKSTLRTFIFSFSADTRNFTDARVPVTQCMHTAAYVRVLSAHQLERMATRKQTAPLAASSLIVTSPSLTVCLGHITVRSHKSFISSSSYTSRRLVHSTARVDTTSKQRERDNKTWQSKKNVSTRVESGRVCDDLICLLLAYPRWAQRETESRSSLIRQTRTTSGTHFNIEIKINSLLLRFT